MITNYDPERVFDRIHGTKKTHVHVNNNYDFKESL